MFGVSAILGVIFFTLLGACSLLRPREAWRLTAGRGRHHLEPDRLELLYTRFTGLLMLVGVVVAVVLMATGKIAVF
jgi:hypothetical protein